MIHHTTSNIHAQRSAKCLTTILKRNNYIGLYPVKSYTASFVDVVLASRSAFTIMTASVKIALVFIATSFSCAAELLPLALGLEELILSILRLNVPNRKALLLSCSRPACRFKGSAFDVRAASAKLVPTFNRMLHIWPCSCVPYGQFLSALS